MTCSHSRQMHLIRPREILTVMPIDAKKAGTPIADEHQILVGVADPAAVLLESCLWFFALARSVRETTV